MVKAIHRPGSPPCGVDYFDRERFDRNEGCVIWRCIVTARLMPMSSDPTSLERCPATATRVESAVAPPGGPLVWRELLTAEPGVVERGSARRTDQPAGRAHLL